MKKLSLIPFLYASVVGAETFHLSVPDCEIESNRPRIQGFGSILETGKPWVPAKAVWILIPPESQVIACTVVGKPQPMLEKHSIVLAPCMMTEGGLVERMEPDSMEMTDTYPSCAGRYLGTWNLSGYEMAKVAIFPLACSPRTGEVWYSSNITVMVDYSAPSQSVRAVDTTFNDMLRDNLLNFEQTEKWYEADPTIAHDYVIVAPTELIPVLNDFLEWKNSIGYRTSIISPDRAGQIENAKYVLVIGEPVDVDGAIVGRIPYTRPRVLTTILDRTIEFELNNKRKTALFVQGTANYENENHSDVPKEEKNGLMEALESVLPADWSSEKLDGEVIHGDYRIIDFLTCGKEWLWDDGDSVPEFKEIRTSEFLMFSESPSLVFSPFAGKKFLKQGAVCVVAPDSFSDYVVGWKDSADGGSQSFNYEFLRCLMEREIVGDAFQATRLWHETRFPCDTVNTREFMIWGDPSLSLRGIPVVDIGIVSTPVKWISPDTGLSLVCRVSNLGRTAETSCKLYCEIDSGGVAVYTQSVAIDTIKPMEDRVVEFLKWDNYWPGVEYRVDFGLFSTRDENPENDTLSAPIRVAAGDFVALDSTGAFEKMLSDLGYEGISLLPDEVFSLGPWYRNFKSIFVSGSEEMDSLPPIPNIYVEGSNIWLSNFIEGEKVNEQIEAPVSGKGFSLVSSFEEVEEWFVPGDCTPIFTDSKDRLAGFCYDNGYKIWCTRFKISEVDSGVRGPLIDSVMSFFEVTASEKQGPRGQQWNITLFESLPNPFHDQTLVKFEIRRKPCRINLSVYSLAGTRVKELLDDFLTIGGYEILWDGTDEKNGSVVNGVYFLRLQTGEEEKLIKLVVFR